MLTLVSQRFPVSGEVSFCIRTLPNRSRNGARSYYYILFAQKECNAICTQRVHLLKIYLISVFQHGSPNPVQDSSQKLFLSIKENLP